MRCSDILKLLFLLPFIGLAAPDTTKIPAKWKHESVIILDQVYRAEESNYEGAKYREYQKTIYYIRDKYGLQQLSTFNIKTYIVPGAEMQIGKIYKKDKTVIELTTKHLIPLYTKIDLHNRKKRWSTYKNDDGQKLAIPSLEVGDILEIEYSTNRKDAIDYLDLAVDYPTLHSESSVSVFGMSPGNLYKVNIQYKAVNFPMEKIEAKDQTISVERYNVDRHLNEALSDEKKLSQYIIIWKKYTGDFPGIAAEKSSKKYTEATGDDLKYEHSLLLNNVLDKGVTDEYYLKVLTKLIDNEIPAINDTIVYLNRLFYYYRELKALNSLKNNVSRDDIVSDEYFVNLVSHLLFEKKIPYKVFVTQEDYFGPPDSWKEIIHAEYGLYFEHYNYYLFNPFLCAFPNQIPPYFEGQTYIAFNAHKYFYEGRKKEKFCNYGLFPGTFPRSTCAENLTRFEINVKEIDLEKQTCRLESKVFYWGKNKSRLTKNICSSTYLYELTDNPYRQAIKTFCPKELANADIEADKEDKYLKDLILDGVKDDGYDPLKLNAYGVPQTNFFESSKPIVTSAEFEANDYVFAYDNYIIVNVGKFLGNQLLYSTRDSVRQNDFFIPYKKKYTYGIKIKIPENYIVENLADLNFVFKSPAGKFESKVVVKDNFVEVETEKDYNFIEYSKKNEKDVKGFVSLATEFTQKKLLFKKIK